MKKKPEQFSVPSCGSHVVLAKAPWGITVGSRKEWLWVTDAVAEGRSVVRIYHCSCIAKPLLCSPLRPMSSSSPEWALLSPVSMEQIHMCQVLAMGNMTWLPICFVVTQDPENISESSPIIHVSFLMW